jgi:hypothetical protein
MKDYPVEATVKDEYALREMLVEKFVEFLQSTSLLPAFIEESSGFVIFTNEKNNPHQQIKAMNQDNFDRNSTQNKELWNCKNYLDK